MNRRARPIGRVSASLLLAGVFLTGCTKNGGSVSEAGLEGLSEQICRMGVESAGLVPLLPDSGDVRVDNREYSFNRTGCRVYVDDALAIDIKIAPVEKFDLARMAPYARFENLQKSLAENLGIADNGAVMGVECGVLGASYLDLEFAILGEEVDDVEQRREDIEAFMYSLASAAKESKKCTA